MAQHQRKNAGAQVITANRLIDGIVVYWSSTGWQETLAAAFVYSAEEAKSALAKVEQASVVDSYFFEVREGSTPPQPASERECIRAAGPSVRLDLGKQAEAS